MPKKMTSLLKKTWKTHKSKKPNTILNWQEQKEKLLKLKDERKKERLLKDELKRKKREFMSEQKRKRNEKSEK